jgi:hypothetical protein
MKLPPSLRAYLDDARGAVRQAPVEVALGLLVAVAYSVQVRGPSSVAWHDWLRIAGLAALAFPLVLGFTVLHARGVIAGALRWGGSAAALAGAALLMARFDPARGADAWRFWLLLTGFCFVLLLVPALPRGPDPDRRARVWSFGFRLMRRLAGVLGYAALLHLALAGAVAAIVALFDLSSPRHLYHDLVSLVYFVVAPWVFAGGIGRLAAPYDPVEALSPLLDIAVRYLLLPVLAIYVVILYAYTAKVLATGQVPANLVSPLVLGAGVAGLLAALLAEPMHADPARRGTSRAYRWFPAILLPLVPLAAVAVFQRIGQYGWTEFRYTRAALLAAVAALAVMGTVRLVRRRPPLQTATLGAFAAVFVLAAVGPLSAPEVSRRDQTARLWSSLRAAGLGDEGARGRLGAGGGAAAGLDSAALARIVEPARYLVGARGAGELAHVLPGVPDTLTGWRLSGYLGLEPACPEGTFYRLAVTADWAGGARLPAAGTLHRWTLEAPGRDTVLAGPRGAVRLRLHRDGIDVGAGGDEASLPLGAVAEAMAGPGEAGGCRRPADGPGARVPLAEATLDLPAAAGTLFVVSWTYQGPAHGEAGREETRGMMRAEGFLLLPE